MLYIKEVLGEVKESNYKASVENEKKMKAEMFELSNPLAATKKTVSSVMDNYTQEIHRPKYDSDIAEMVEVVRILNNLAPLRMPVYNFNLDEINGEHYYRPDGSLLLVREYDSDVIRDYYAETDPEKLQNVNRILEHDKKTGRLRTKIEPIVGHGANLKINVTIFDLKINNKYTLMQLTEEGYVNNITEFTGEGKSFQTLYRNILTFKPARYIEGKDDKEVGFKMVDCIFDSNGSIARIKRYTSKKEVCIDYTDDKKTITVKTKEG